MTVYSFFIFDRHADCIYQRRFPAPETLVREPAPNSSDQRPKTPRRSQADDAQLLFGVMHSLRTLTHRLGGPADEFISYRTATYKLHYYETPTSLKFVLLTDIKMRDLRVVLHQIWANLYVEYVVRNPLAVVDPGREGPGAQLVGKAKNAVMRGGGQSVGGNEMFELGLDRFISQVFGSAGSAGSAG